MSTFPTIRRGALTLSVLLLAATTTVAEAPPAALPSGQEILHRAFDVSGGKAMKALENRVLVGSFSVPAQGLSGKTLTYLARPNHFLNVIEMPMLGQMKQGFDGETAWAVDAIQGPRLIEGPELEQLKLQSDFDGDLSKHFSKVETQGRETFEGQDAYVVEMATNDGLEVTGFFGVTSGLMVGMKMNAPTPYGPVPVTAVMTDYADMGGMKVPKRTVTKMMGMEQVMAIEEVRVNVADLPSFAPPAEIQALKKEAAAAK